MDTNNPKTDAESPSHESPLPALAVDLALKPEPEPESESSLLTDVSTEKASDYVKTTDQTMTPSYSASDVSTPKNPNRQSIVSRLLGVGGHPESTSEVTATPEIENNSSSSSKLKSEVEILRKSILDKHRLEQDRLEAVEHEKEEKEEKERIAVLVKEHEEYEKRISERVRAHSTGATETKTQKSQSRSRSSSPQSSNENSPTITTKRPSLHKEF